MDKAFFTQSFLSKTFHNWKGDKDFFKSLEWKIDSAFLNWLQTLRLDAYISLCLATDSLDDVAGDENQIKVAKAVGINHLSTLYHAISMLGYKNILKYSLVKESTNTFELTLLVLEMLRMGIPRNEIDPVLNHLDFHNERIQMLKKIKDKHFPRPTA